jgi:DNA replication protein DnaC
LSLTTKIATSLDAARARPPGCADQPAKRLVELLADAGFDPTVPPPEASRTCASGCGASVARRGDYCDGCAALGRFRHRSMALERAYASVSAGGKMTFCRPGWPEYEAATRKAREAAARLPEPTARERAIEVIDGALWKRTHGNMTILGPTGYGKSKVLRAIGLRVIDLALYGEVDKDRHDFARRVRYAYGLDLARARAASKLGEEPAAFAEARAASLLLLDEIGFEDQRTDPVAIRDLVYWRYDNGLPTVVTSGSKIAELEARYGEATMRRLWEGGRLVDLHAAPRPERGRK